MIKVVCWDLDGTLIDSNEVRTNGFKYIFKSFPEKKTSKLIQYHRENGGLSRYHKISYFFEYILKTKIEENTIINYASQYANYMKQHLLNSTLKYSYTDSLLNCLKNYSQVLITASDQVEAKQVCKAIKIEHFFKKIYGSPKTKEQNFQKLKKNMLQDFNELIYVGDTLNDFEVCKKLDIEFIGINNLALKSLTTNYIENNDELNSLRSILKI